MTNGYRKPHIMDLPFELLVLIFKKLTLRERNVTSETCNSWYLTANNYSFNKKKIITSPNNKIAVIKILQTFLNSLVTFYNCRFYMLCMSDVVNDFFAQLGYKLRTLEIYNSELHYVDVIVILNSCKELEELRLSCKFIRPESPSTITNDKLNYLLPKLKSLDLSGSNVYDAIFGTLVKYSPAIEKLNLRDCSLHLDSNLGEMNINDLYQFKPTDTENPSIVYFTFSYVLEFIKSRSKKIKHLVLTEIDDAVIMSLSKFEDLFLESFEFSSSLTITEEVISEFIKKQVYLKKLCPRFALSDKFVLNVCNYLSDLESLKLDFCYDLTDYGISELHKLKKLRTLRLLPFDLITNEGIKRGLSKQQNSFLEELCLAFFRNLSEITLINVPKLFPNLKQLDISYCKNAVTDKSLQAIFKYQTQLEVLKLKGCDKVYYLGTCDEDDEKLSNVRNDKTKTGLYSLKKLKELNLEDCSNIKSKCITRSFHLPKLVKLNLASCFNLTDENMKSIAQNCPNIVHLNVCKCINLTVETVEIIGNSWKYLKYLDMSVIL